MVYVDETPALLTTTAPADAMIGRFMCGGKVQAGMGAGLLMKDTL